MTTPPSKQLDQFVVRLPDGMRDRIKAAAEANNRSMNAEIVATLEEKYPPVDPWVSAIHALRAMNETIRSLPNGPEKLAALEQARAFSVGVTTAFLQQIGDVEPPTKEIADSLADLRNFLKDETAAKS
ncbi:Arc family DNA-binding protein [Paracoccus aerius]|uniref:Arc family DNA-binding protein n=1 Tax=Paracoccus aerius TaxID=1915382 RepID=A0ABS1SAR2_9RHOB|nr:Arc family DNA-binding protein [Paracoccus aerius]MBL3675831.1 Arc family DNA-binding protein [Paracoccus aerius]GHG37775.1 hypothetical protein GCM10017322_40520 [Paracoccus aerius]